MSSRWQDVGEKGTVLGMRFFVWVLKFLGRTPARALLRVVILYYVVFHRGVRRSSADYLRHIGIEPRFGNVYRHVLTFGYCILDRFFLIQGRTDLFQVSTNGHQHLARLRDEKRGAILLGAHLGSFEAMRARGGDERLGISMVGDFRNAKMINAQLRRFDPHSGFQFVELSPNSVDFVLDIKHRIERGEMIAILGDRVGADGKYVEVPFFGDTARLPVGPFMLAAVLRCPIYLTFGLYRGDNRYELYCEPFAERVELPRQKRTEALASLAANFAERLEHYCRKAPYNWFNFYDYWGTS